MSIESFILDVLLRLGFPTAVVFAIAKGWLVPGFIYTEEVAERKRLSLLAEEKLIPMVVESQNLLKEALEVLTEYDPPPAPVPPPPRRRRGAGG